MKTEINGPNEETMNIAKRILSAEIRDSIPLSQVKLLAEAVIQFQEAAERVRLLCEQRQAGYLKGDKR